MDLHGIPQFIPGFALISINWRPTSGHVSIHGSVCADLSPWTLAHSMLLSWENEKRHVINPIHGAAIYGNIYHQYTPVMLASIYQHQPDPSWVMNHPHLRLIFTYFYHVHDESLRFGGDLDFWDKLNKKTRFTKCAGSNLCANPPDR